MNSCPPSIGLEDHALRVVLGTLWHEQQKWKPDAEITLTKEPASKGGMIRLRILWEEDGNCHACEQRFPQVYTPQGLTGMCRELVRSCSERFK